MDSWCNPTGKYIGDKGLASLLTSVVNANEDSVITVINLSGGLLLESMILKTAILRARESVYSQNTTPITSTIWSS